jgi:hypothetical protein
MSLRVAVQMDPLESIKIAGDSSFALMLSAQVRGHELFHYDVGGLTLDEDGRLVRPPARCACGACQAIISKQARRAGSTWAATWTWC